jgi:hypothetical protein
MRNKRNYNNTILKHTPVFFYGNESEVRWRWWRQESAVRWRWWGNNAVLHNPLPLFLAPLITDDNSDKCPS